MSLTASGNAIQETVWLFDLPIATLRPNGAGAAIYPIHPDELGSPRVITDLSNQPVWRWDSDAFGNGAPNEDPRATGSKFSYNLRFPDQYFDKELGLYYNNFRDYYPGTGRYVESDPIGLEGGGIHTATGALVQELASVGILDYLSVYTSHHKLVYRRIDSDTYVYLIAGHRQDYPTMLEKRLLSR